VPHMKLSQSLLFERTSEVALSAPKTYFILIPVHHFQAQWIPRGLELDFSKVTKLFPPLISVQVMLVRKEVLLLKSNLGSGMCLNSLSSCHFYLVGRLILG
jgi:hypothetical protein